MEVMELLKKARAGDRRARDQMVKENVGLVWNIVRRFNGRGYDPEDLFQIGCIGLIKAIDHFNLNFEVRFSTYAVPMIMATVDEIAAVTELEPEEIAVAIEANREVESIYRPVYRPEGKEICMIDQVVAGSSASVGYVARTSVAGSGRGEVESGADKEKDRVLNRILVEQLLDTLEEKERRLIRLRYYEDMTQTNVAREMGISQVQVSRMEKKILLRLRNELSE